MSTDAAAEQRYQLLTSNDKIISITAKALAQSTTLAACAASTDADKEPIPVKNISEKTMRKVVEWCEYHTTDNGDGDDEHEKWVKEFTEQFDMDELFDIICAANFLDIYSLLHSSSRVVSNMIDGKGPEQIRRLLRIPTDAEVHAEAAAAKLAGART